MNLSLHLSLFDLTLCVLLFAVISSVTRGFIYVMALCAMLFFGIQFMEYFIAGVFN